MNADDAAACARPPHVTHGRIASIYATQLRGQSHESLACLAANLVVALDAASWALEQQLNDPTATLDEGFRAAERIRDVLRSTDLVLR